MKEIVTEDKCSETTVIIIGDAFTWISHITQTQKAWIYLAAFNEIMYSSDNLSHLTWDFTDGARGLVILIIIIIICWPGPLRHGHYLYLGVMILTHWVSLDWVLWVRDRGSVTLTQRNDRGWPAQREEPGATRSLCTVSVSSMSYRHSKYYYTALFNVNMFYE